MRMNIIPMLGQAQTPDQAAQQMNIMRLMQSANSQQSRAAQAHQMMQRGNNGAAGYLGALAMGVGGYLNKKKQDEAEEKQLEALQEIGLLRQSQGDWSQEQAQLKAQQERAVQAQKITSLSAIYGEDAAKAIVFGGAKPSDFKKDETSLMKNLAAAGIEQGSPEYQKAILSQLNKSDAPVVNVNSGETSTEFQKKLAGKNADSFSKWQDEAFAANETMAGISQMREISNLQSTGKMAEAQAIVGQYFGTQAASDMQAFNSIASSMVLQQAEKLSGAMSDGDIKLLESTMPQFGNDPRANETIYGVLERASNRAVKRFNDADMYVQEHGKLAGYKPEFKFSRTESKKQPQQKQGGQIMEDANGNRAMVYPDGSFEEL